MKGDFHVRFCENLRVKLPWVTRLWLIGLAPWTQTYKPTNSVDKNLKNIDATATIYNSVTVYMSEDGG